MLTSRRLTGPLRERARTPAAAAFWLALVLAGGTPDAPSRELAEHQVKAGILFNFAAFVSWPRECFANPSSPLRYCVLGADAVGATLEGLLAGETFDGRPLELRILHAPAGLGRCHILFFGAGAGSPAVLDAVPGTTTLTVGETDSFIENGGMIALLRKRKRIHPVINLDALEASRLRLSSKLLRLSTRLRPGATE